MLNNVKRRKKPILIITRKRHSLLKESETAPFVRDYHFEDHKSPPAPLQLGISLNSETFPPLHSKIPKSATDWAPNLNPHISVKNDDRGLKQRPA